MVLSATAKQTGPEAYRFPSSLNGLVHIESQGHLHSIVSVQSKLETCINQEEWRLLGCYAVWPL
jgi:hypothetical protein